MPRTITPPECQQLADLDAEIAACTDAAVRARLHHAAGRLIEERLERPRDALPRYQEAIAEDPGYLPALRDARRLYRATGQLLMVAEMLAKEARRSADPAARAGLLWERGEVLARVGANPGDVRAAYEEALLADPSNLPGFQALATLLAGVEDWMALSDTCRRAAEAARDPSVKAGILCELARHTELREGDDQTACNTYARAADTDSSHLTALIEVERLARKLSRHALLAKTLERMAAQSGAGPAAARDLEEVARLRFHHLDDEPGAVEGLRAAMAADPEHVPTFDRTEDLFVDFEAWDDLAELLRRRAEVTLEPEERAAVLCRQAAVLASRLDRPREAADAWREALAYCPTYLPALRALGGVLSAAADWEGLVELFLAEADAVEDPDLQGARWLRAAEILEHRLQDSGRAVGVLQLAVHSAPGRLGALRNLVRLLSWGGRWEEAAGVLDSEARRGVPDDLRAEFLRRLAEIRELHLRDLPGAAAALDELLALRPDDAEVREGLIRLHRRMGSWEEVVRIRQEEAERLSDSRAIAAALQEVGEILEVQVRDAAAAEAAYRRVLAVHPGYVPALRALGRILRGTERYEDLLEVYRKDVEVAADDDHRAACLLRVGEVLRVHLDQPEEAEEVYREALDLRPGDQAALSALEELLRDRGDDIALVDVLEARVAAAGDERDRVRHLCALAEVLEEAGAAPAELVEAWQRAVAVDPGCVPALRALARLHEAAGRWGDFSTVLERVLDVTADPVRNLRRALRLASVRRDRLGDAAGALSAYREALAGDPCHVPTLQALDSLLREARRGQPEERIVVLEGLAAVVDDPAVAASTRLAAARLREASGHTAEARDNHLATLAIRPGDPLALEAAEVILRQEEDWSRLAAVHREARDATDDPEVRADHAARTAGALARAGDDAAARAVLEEAVEESPDDPVLVAALADARGRTRDRPGELAAREALARLRKDGGRCVAELVTCGDDWQAEGVPERALALWEEAFLLTPGENKALDRLTAALRDRGETERLVGVLENGLEISGEAPTRAALAWRLARLHRGGGDLMRASRALAAVVESTPDDLEALRVRAGLLEDLVEVEEAAEAWDRVAALAEAEEDRREAWLAVGRLRASLPGGRARAEEALLAVLEAWPEDVEALTVLKEVRQAGGDADGAVWAAERLARLLRDPDDKLEELLEVARLHGLRRDLAAAGNALARARELDPLAPEPVRELGRMLDEAGDLRGVETLFRKYLEALPPGAAARGIPFRVELGHLLWERDGEVGGALEQYVRVVELDPEHEGAREALAFLYAQTRDGLERAQEQHRILLTADPLRIDSYLALLRIFERMQDDDLAFLCAGVLESFGALSEADRAGLEEYRRRLPVTPRGALDAAERAGYLQGGGDEVRAFLQGLRPLAGRLTEKRRKALGAVRGRRLGRRDGDPLLGLVERIAAWLGVLELDAYRVPEGDAPVTVVPGDPPALVVHAAAFDTLELPARRFHLAHGVALCEPGVGLLEEHGPEWVVGMMLAAAPDCDPDEMGEGVLSEEEREAVRASVADSGPRRLARSAGRPAAEALEALDLGVLVDQAEGLLFTADRAGMLACGDAGVTLHAIAGPPLGQAPAERAAALRERPDVTALLAFLLSDEHLSLRSRLGMRLD